MNARPHPAAAPGRSAIRPVYVMAKPDGAARAAMCRERRRLGLDERYDPSWLHMTLLPVGDARDLTAELLGRIDRAIAALSVGPCWLIFDRVVGTALRGGSMREALRLQRELAHWLSAFGVPVPRYSFRPHVSLAYGGRRPNVAAIAPIRWRVAELLLVESVHGQGRHVPLRRWPLAGRQHDLPL